jgi:hypothetical protein
MHCPGPGSVDLSGERAGGRQQSGVARILRIEARSQFGSLRPGRRIDMKTTDVKNELSKGLDKLTTLRDEAKLHLHLASLDAKQEWNEKLEPRIDELQRGAAEMSDGTKAAVQDLLTRVEGFVANLRGKGSDDGAADKKN